MTPLAELRHAAAEALRPDPEYTVSEWADVHRFLTSKESPEPGPWRTARVPYMREIMDALSPSSPVRDVCFMKSSQVAGTEAINNWIGFVIHHAPGPMLVVQPTVEIAERFSRQRIAPLIDNSPELRKRIAEPRAKDGGNTLLSKEFPGGMLILGGANSAAALRSMPIRFLGLDEIDAYPPDVDGEGDPVALAEQRTQNFSRRKRFKNSTPTVKGFSRIEQEYEESDQRRFYVPCPHCEHFQVLIWHQVKWENNDPKTAMYCCEGCGVLWSEAERHRAVRHGEWRAKHPERQKRGYHIWAAYSPWVRLEDLVTEFLSAKSHPERLKTFVNTKLGQVWDDGGESLDVGSFTREKYEAPVPLGVGVLTAGVDTQGDRLEVTVRGWGRGEESWLIHHEQLWGDPDSNDVWERLEAIRVREWEHEAGGTLRIRSMCIDSGGHHTDAVYRWVKPRQGAGVWAVKGLSVPGKPPVGRPSKANKHGVKLLPLGVDTIKDTLFARWRIKQAGPGYMHFPAGLDEEYFRQLTAESVVTRYVKGRPVRSYEKKQGVRNEALDLEVYAFAALVQLGTPVRDNLGGYVDRAKAEGEKRRADANHVPEPEDEDTTLTTPPPQRPVRQSGWATMGGAIGGWGR